MTKYCINSAITITVIHREHITRTGFIVPDFDYVTCNVHLLNGLHFLIQHKELPRTANAVRITKRLALEKPSQSMAYV
jgi:hypothetical protein